MRPIPDKKQYLVVLLFLTTGFSASHAQNVPNPETIILGVADRVLDSTPFELMEAGSGRTYRSPEEAPREAVLSLTSPYNDWRYWNGVINLAMLALGSVTGDDRYTAFAEKNIAFGFDAQAYFQRLHKEQNKWNYPFGQFFMMEELDDCGAMGASVIEVYQRNPVERYRQYIENAAEHVLSKQQRLKDGTLVRSFPVKWTLWADDLYMGLAFLSRYAAWKGNTASFDNAAGQVIRFHHYLFDENRELMHHCWYSDNEKPGTAYWGRANGWALLAQIDLLERLPLDHPYRDTLTVLFQRHILGVAKYQSANGLWHQLLDKTDSYLETSCSAMFTYAIARAVNKGFLDKRYASIAVTGWEGLQTRIRPDGQVEGVCAGTVVRDDLKYYYLRPTPLNDIHGIGTVILAGSEILTLINTVEH